jgi:hypothetical protein
VVLNIAQGDRELHEAAFGSLFPGLSLSYSELGPCLFSQ